MAEKIVTVELNGGLCNRLFQIACCLGYAERFNYTPIFYTCFFKNNEHSAIILEFLLKLSVISLTTSFDINQIDHNSIIVENLINKIGTPKEKNIISNSNSKIY